MLIAKKKSKITLADILEGTEAGRVQQVKYLQVIPILSEEEDSNLITCSNDLQKSGVKKKSVGPGNTLQATPQKLQIMPYSLYWKQAHGAQADMSKPGFSEFDTRLGVNTWGHLEYYLDKNGSALDQLMAEFEPLPQQVGAIFLLGGKLIGIERSPSHASWQSIREELLRKYYGPWALSYAQSLGTAPPLPNRVALASTYSNLEALKKDYLVLRRREIAYAKETIESWMDMQFALKKEKQLRGYTLESFQEAQLQGQIVHKSDKAICVSIICQESKYTRQGVRQTRLANL